MRTTFTAAITALLLTALGAGLAPAADAQDARRQDDQPRVTWSGWDAATLGKPVAKAARQLHKPVDGTCRPVYRIDQLPTGLYISNQVRRHRTIDDITVAQPYEEPTPTIRGPFSIHVGMGMKALRSKIKHSGQTLHNRKNTETGRRGDYWVKGGHGHVLWFRLGLFTDDGDGGFDYHQRQVSAFTLNKTKSDAFQDMEFTGGC